MNHLRLIFLFCLFYGTSAHAQQPPPLDQPLEFKPEYRAKRVEPANPAEPAKPPKQKSVEPSQPAEKPESGGVHRGPATALPTVPAAPPEPAPVPTPAPKPAPDPVPAPEPEGPPDPEPTPPVAPEKNVAARTDIGLRDSENPEFRMFTLSPQVGYTYYTDSSYVYDGLPLRVDQRNSFTFKLHLDFGGDKFAMELAPLFSMEQVGGDISTIGTDLGSGVGGKFFAVGGQMNVVFRIPAKRFYPHFGIGFHGTSIFGPEIQYGAELYGRIPLGFTLYISEAVGLVFEGAFLYGVTGIRGPDPDIAQIEQSLLNDYNIDINDIDWSNTTPEEVQAQYNLSDTEIDRIVDEQIGESIQFGKGWALEFMIGMRFL